MTRSPGIRQALRTVLGRRNPASDVTIPGGMLCGHSIEILPRTAANVLDFRALLPAGTRVYIAHIDGVPIRHMVETAARLTLEGFTPMPHFAARRIRDAAMLADWIARYQGEADVKEALVIGGGDAAPRGDFDSAIALLKTGAFDRAGFTRLHIAGHPEGSRDIDPYGGTANADAALMWKHGFSEQTDAKMVIVTQFGFEAAPILAWEERMRGQGVSLPIHLGIAGPAKLQTLIKYALACGVGPSMQVLQKRAMDVSKLLLPYTPDALISDLAPAFAGDRLFAQLHLFPLGGIAATAQWAAEQSKAALPSAVPN